MESAVWHGSINGSHGKKILEIENIVPERRAELIEDLTQRLGNEIKNVEIESVSFLRDTARLKVQFIPRETDR